MPTTLELIALFQMVDYAVYIVGGALLYFLIKYKFL